MLQREVPRRRVSQQGFVNGKLASGRLLDRKFVYGKLVQKDILLECLADASQFIYRSSMEVGLVNIGEL